MFCIRISRIRLSVATRGANDHYRCLGQTYPWVPLEWITVSVQAVERKDKLYIKASFIYVSPGPLQSSSPCTAVASLRPRYSATICLGNLVKASLETHFRQDRLVGRHARISSESTQHQALPVHSLTDRDRHLRAAHEPYRNLYSVHSGRDPYRMRTLIILHHIQLL